MNGRQTMLVQSVRFTEAVAACRLEYVDRRITEQHFLSAGPPADIGEILVFRQADFGGRYMTDAQFEATTEKWGLRSATVAELLVYGKERWNGRDRVAALDYPRTGSGRRPVPHLSKSNDDKKRSLFLLWFQRTHRMGVRTLFLCVRK